MQSELASEFRDFLDTQSPQCVCRHYVTHTYWNHGKTSQATSQSGLISFALGKTTSGRSLRPETTLGAAATSMAVEDFPGHRLPNPQPVWFKLSGFHHCSRPVKKQYPQHPTPLGLGAQCQVSSLPGPRPEIPNLPKVSHPENILSWIVAEPTKAVYIWHPHPVTQSLISSCGFASQTKAEAGLQWLKLILAHICIRTYIHSYMYLSYYTSIYIYISMCVRVYVLLYVYVHIHIYLFVYSFVYLYRVAIQYATCVSGLPARALPALGAPPRGGGGDPPAVTCLRFLQQPPSAL